MLLDYNDMKNVNERKRLQCAFGSANTIDRDLVVSQLSSMKVFYAMNSVILDEVKDIVKNYVELIGLDAKQMHFMYTI